MNKRNTPLFLMIVATAIQPQQLYNYPFISTKRQDVRNMTIVLKMIRDTNEGPTM